MISRFYFLFLSIRRNAGFILFLLLQYLLGFVIIHSGIEEIFITCLSRMNHVYEAPDSNVIWLDGAMRNNTHDINDYADFFDELRRNDYVDDYGYIRRTSAYVDGIRADLEGLDPVSGSWKLKLKEGSWFDYDDPQTQLIIGGALSKDHKIGEVLEYTIPYYEGQKITYKSISGLIIGVLEQRANTISLGLSATEPMFVDILVEHENVILTNDYASIDQSGAAGRISSLLLSYNGSFDQAHSELMKYGNSFTLDQINAFTEDYFKYVIIESFPMMLLILAMVIYGIISIGYIFIYRNQEAMAVFELCGQSRNQRKRLILLLNSIPMIIGLVLSLLALKIPLVKNFLRLYSNVSAIHVIASFAAALIFQLVIILSVNLSFKKNVIANIRRTE